MGIKSATDKMVTAALAHFSDYEQVSTEKPVIHYRTESSQSRHTSPLKYPAKLLIDTLNQRLYISDSSNYRVVATDLNGKFQFSVGSGRNGLKDGPFGK